MFACQDTLLRRIILRDMYQFQARAVGGIYQLRKSANFARVEIKIRQLMLIKPQALLEKYFLHASEKNLYSPVIFSQFLAAACIT